MQIVYVDPRSKYVDMQINVNLHCDVEMRDNYIYKIKQTEQFLNDDKYLVNLIQYQ